MSRTTPQQLVTEALLKLKDARDEPNAVVAHRMYAEVTACATLATARFAEDRDRRERGSN